MKHLINREDYIREYLRVYKSIDNMIDNEIKNENELHEGLLSAVFGGLKMLFKKDWANIKCKNPTVLEHLKEMDKKLAGFTTTKMQFYSECNNIRQNIADYFNDILEYKLLEIEKAEDPNKFIESENEEGDKNTESDKVARKLKLKDKTLLDSLKKYKENIATACKVSPKLREYADQMLNSVTVFVNGIVISELEKKGVDKEKLEEMIEDNKNEQTEMEQEMKEKDEETKKEAEEILKKITEERDKALNDLGIKPIGEMGGDKAMDMIIKQFADVLENFNNAKLNESNLPGNYGEILGSDTYLGLQKSLDEIDWTADDKSDQQDLLNRLFIRVIVNKINTAFGVISEQKGKFSEIPSASVQAMMVSIANAIIYGYVGEKFDIANNKSRLSLMTKCAIDSDATIGFNLPLIDEKKPENGNFYVSIMNQFASKSVSSKEVVDIVTKMTPEELKKLYDLWESKKDDSNEKGNDESKGNDEAQGDKGEDKKEITADPKTEEFAIEFANIYGSDMMKDFQNNMGKLFKLIVDEAKAIKEDAAKKREEEAKKEQQESDAEAKEVE